MTRTDRADDSGAVKRYRAKPETSYASGYAANTLQGIAMAELAETDSCIESPAHRCSIIGKFVMALFLVPLLVAVVAGSAFLTFWAFEMLGETGLRTAATAALVGATVGSLELILLVHRKGSPLVLTLAVLTFVASVCVHVFLSQARARMIAEAVGISSAPAVTIDGTPSTSNSSRDAFEQEMLQIMSKTVPMLSLVLETAGGLLLHQILEMFFGPVAIAVWINIKLRRKLKRFLSPKRETWWTRERILAVVVPALVIAVALALAKPAFPATTLDPDVRIGIAVDLSTSRTQLNLDQDIALVAGLLIQVPARARIAIVGVTQDAFAAPCVLLEARVEGDPGFMNRNLAKAHSALQEAWRKKSAGLVPKYHGSDIAGSIVRLARMLDIAADRPGFVLVLSDGRQTHGINLEALTKVPDDTTKIVRESGLVANLAGVQLAMGGISTTGKSQCFFESLRDFWISYSRVTQSALVGFQIGRGPELRPGYLTVPISHSKFRGGICTTVESSPGIKTSPSVPAISPPAAPVQLTSVSNHMLVNHEEQIEGLVRDPTERVILVVRPEPGMEFWCAEPVHVDSSGRFTGTVFFGRSPTLDNGVTYQLAAVINYGSCTKPGVVLAGWPDGPRSVIFEVIRR